MSRAPVLTLCLAVAAAFASGCGISADRDHVRATAQRLSLAIARHDGAAACAQLSPQLRTQLVKDQGSPCPKAVLGLGLRDGAPGDVQVYADEALVRLSGGDTLFLGDTRLGWRVDALGCRPQGKGPYDCEEQA